MIKPEPRIAVIVLRARAMTYWTHSPASCDTPGPSRVILVIDDTSPAGDTANAIHELSADIAVIPPTLRASGSRGGSLWVNLAAGYRWMLERYEPRIILRLDADALLIGPGLEECAEREFARCPAVGILGACRIGPDGGARDPSWAARELRIETRLLGLRHPQCRSRLRYFLKLAHRNGYIDGESALGGAYIHSYRAARSIHDRGWFSQPWLAPSYLGEDHIMSALRPPRPASSSANSAGRRTLWP